MGVKFLGNVTIPTIIIGKGKGRYANIFLLSTSENGALYRQKIKDGSITWSDESNSNEPIAIDGNAYTNNSYIAYGD